LITGIDPSLSARIEREEKEANTTTAVTPSRPTISLGNTSILFLVMYPNKYKYILGRKMDHRNDSDNDDFEENQRKKRADLAAAAAQRRASNANNSTNHVCQYIFVNYFLIKFAIG
jgi:hypothetical protein